MKYDRNKIKDIFRDGITYLYLDGEQDDFCNFVEQLQREKEELKQQLSQLQEENKLLKKEYRIANKDNKKLYDKSMIAIKYWQEEYRQLQQEKEEIIKWLEDEDKNLWATATDGHKFIKNLSLIERRTTLREILSKLKESDKDVS